MCNRKAWILFLFTCLYLPCSAWWLTGCGKKPPSEQPAEKLPDEKPSTAREAPPAAYLPVGEAALRDFESGTEYIVSGKVTTESMEPLEGATVSAYGSAPRWNPPNFELPSPLSAQICDDAGSYQVRINIPANVWIVVKMDGYAPVVTFLPVRDTKIAVRDYQLQPAAASLSGVVSDKKDLPVAGAMVVANTPPFTLLPDNVILMPIGHVADAAGKYTIEGLPEGDVSLVATARGYMQQEELSPLRKGVNDLVNFNLPTAAPLSIAVKNGRGDALINAMATALGYFKIAGADKRGVVEFSVPLEVGPFECTVAADTYRSSTFLLDPKAPPASIVLEDRPILKGRVTTETGEVVAGMLISVFGTGGAQGKFDGAAPTDSNGRFELPLTYPPVREIRTSRTGFFDQRIPFDKGKPAPTEVAIRVKRVETGMYGRVIDYRGIPVRRFVLHLRDNKPGGQEFQRSFSTGNGRYMVTDVAPGVYDLVIQSVASSTAEDVQLFRMEKVEIRKGFLLGEVLSQFPKPKYVK